MYRKEEQQSIESARWSVSVQWSFVGKGGRRFRRQRSELQQSGGPIEPALAGLELWQLPRPARQMRSRSRKGCECNVVLEGRRLGLTEARQRDRQDSLQ